jgi:hypothetical protein
MNGVERISPSMETRFSPPVRIEAATGYNRSKARALE